MTDFDTTNDITPEPAGQDTQDENMWMRLLWLILVAILISLANTVQFVLAVIQFIIMIVNKSKPNENLAEFGTALGLWFAKAVRYQSAASTAKPWPWSDLD